MKFFRRIRQQLFSENKPASSAGGSALPKGRYIKYAIGEIVLVVIGILIALQVNNWNEERKLKAEERSTLEKLQKESEDVVDYAADMYNRYINAINAIDASAQALRDKSLHNLSEDEFARGVFITAYFEAISPPKNAYMELNSTGKIQNIKSENVKKSISSYYAELEYINTQLVYFRNQYTKPVDQACEDFFYTYDETDPAKIKANFNFDRLCENRIFVSKHVKALRDQIVFNSARKELLDKAVQMCSEISKELNMECNSEKSAH